MLDLTYTAPQPKVIAGAKHDWELVIGMEIHAQVSSDAQLFSGAATTFGAQPNSNVAFVDAAIRPQELLLPRPAAGLSDQPALPPHRG